MTISCLGFYDMTYETFKFIIDVTLENSFNISLIKSFIVGM